MTQIKDAWLERRRRRWMRPNAHLYIRRDTWRFMPPGSPRYVGRDVVKYFWPDPEGDRAPDDRPRAYQHKYAPDQPRVPAGNSDGGQWTSEDGNGVAKPSIGTARNDPGVLSDVTPDNFFEPGTQLAANETQSSYTVNLYEEEAPRGIGHTISDHVGKTDEELLTTLRQRRFDFPIRSYIGRRQGSFESIETANDFINRTLEQNKSAVDQVASGSASRDFVTARFGYITGREAYRPNPDADPYLRNTYGVGVEIRHDPRAGRGYRVFTAYPRND